MVMADPRKNIKLSAEAYRLLEGLVERYKKVKSPTKLVSDIAGGEIALVPGWDYFQPKPGLYLGINSDAEVMYVGSGEITPETKTRLKSEGVTGFVAVPIPPNKQQQALEGAIAMIDPPLNRPEWRVASQIRAFIEARQPFVIQYRDVSDRTWGYSVRFAQIVPRPYKPGAFRWHLDCWCDETERNADIPEFQHNWSLRVDDDRYRSAELFPIDGEWRDGRDGLPVTIEFKNGLAWGYEGHPDDISDTGPGSERQIVRNCDSTHWLWQDLSRYGSNAKVLGPEPVRERMKSYIQAMLAEY